MKLAAAAKPAVIALLALAMFVPVTMIQGLIAERQARRDVAVAGIAQGWGARQTLAGPYLAVPYWRTWTEVVQETIDGRPRERRTERTESRLLRLPADSVDWRIGAKVSEKARGIYKARLYSASAEARGRFNLPARFGLNDSASRIKWGTPRLVVGVSDPGGIRSVSPLVIAGAGHAIEAGSGDTAALPGGVHVPLPGLVGSRAAQPQSFEFAFAIELAGSTAFAVAPLGSNTTVTMRSDWPHPSFAGRFLPLRHEIGAQGFLAEWQVSQYAAPGVANRQELAVSFIEPAGLYQQLERASKYGFLFIGLTFAAFLLFELLRRLALHPIQYALVGLALAMFFLLLTALSEHIDFALAYAIATFACVGLIAGYLVRVLRSAALGLAFGGALGALYAMLYALLKAEDYSLLGGAMLLFGLLAAVMIATRRVDWYGLTTPQPQLS
ncbi:MAG: cell envelope integrity protein CreD [Betaproteobacteria bacterium]|nr:cell envelope integrity protein CreD [Betaproteobacteria bacterium]